MNRYREDTGAIIDQRTGGILTIKQVVNKLNRYEKIKQMARAHHQAMSDALNDEIEKADGELKTALIRISNRRIDYEVKE